MSPESLDNVIAQFLLVREDAERAPERYAELVKKLDGFFWRSVEGIISDALVATDAELSFRPPQKMLINAGLLDVRLVENAGPDFAERLAAELRAPGDDNIVHLDEWLSRRYRFFLTTRELPDDRVKQSVLLRAAAASDRELETARAQRNELYRRLAGLFKDLPGVSAELAAAVTAGTVDDRIEELLLAEMVTAGESGRAKKSGVASETVLQARRYDGAVRKLLGLARERSSDEEDLRYLETVETLRMAILRKSTVHSRKSSADAGPVPAESGPAAAPPLAEAMGFMRREIKLIRSLLRIGSQEGRVAHACSVLLRDTARTTKPAVGRILDLVREVDPRVGLHHDMLIAPFTGSGFFEWDRDCLVMALTPARGVEDAVVNAVANFRLLADARRGAGKIAAAYRALHGENFRERFIADYRAWVIKAGRGRREALSDEACEFFMTHLGPGAGGAVLPSELVHLSVRERDERIGHLSTLARGGGATATELYNLGSLLWQAERIDEALRHMEAAAAAAPTSGRALYSLGALCRRRHMLAAARKAFKDCARVAPDTLWAIYAHDAVRRMG